MLTFKETLVAEEAEVETTMTLGIMGDSSQTMAPWKEITMEEGTQVDHMEVKDWSQTVPYYNVSWEVDKDVRFCFFFLCSQVAMVQVVVAVAAMGQGDIKVCIFMVSSF